MIKRIITGLFLLIVLTPVLFLPFKAIVYISYFLFGALAVIACLEVLHISHKEKKYNIKVKIVASLCTILIYMAGISIFKSHQITLLGPGFIFEINPTVSYALILLALIAELSLLVFDTDFDAKDMGRMLLATFYPGFGLASIIILRTIAVRWVIYLLMITSLTDIFAYVYGMLFGKHKMIERISPKKTWEGAIGGTIIASIVAGLFAYLYGNLFRDNNNLKTIFDIFGGFSTTPNYVQLIIIFSVTIIISIMSQIGDLIASKLKRTYDVKDFSHIFPGHGGVLDRFDSASFAGMFLVAIILVLTYAFGV